MVERAAIGIAFATKDSQIDSKADIVINEADFDRIQYV